MVKRGFVNIHYYYIPIHKVEGWNGHVLWLKITEAETRSKYEKDMMPDPSRYYVKDYPYYAATNYPEFLIIQPRHKRPVFTAPTAPDIPPVHKCDLWYYAAKWRRFKQACFIAALTVTFCEIYYLDILQETQLDDSNTV